MKTKLLIIFAICSALSALAMPKEFERIIPAVDSKQYNQWSGSESFVHGVEAINNKEYDNAVSCLKETSAVALEYGVAEVSDEALSLIPNALMRKGSTLFRDKDFENAAASLAEVVALEPGNGQAFLMLGQSYLQTGKTDEAMSRYN